MSIQSIAKLSETVVAKNVDALTSAAGRIPSHRVLLESWPALALETLRELGFGARLDAMVEPIQVSIEYIHAPPSFNAPAPEYVKFDRPGHEELTLYIFASEWQGTRHGSALCVKHEFGERMYQTANEDWGSEMNVVGLVGNAMHAVHAPSHDTGRFLRFHVSSA